MTHILKFENGEYDYTWMICKDKDGEEHFKFPIKAFNSDDKFAKLLSNYKKIKELDKKFALAFVGEYYLSKQYLYEDANDLREMIMYSEENEEDIFNEPKYTENSIEKINAIEEIVDVIISDFEGEEEHLKRLIEIDKFCGNNITLEEERIKLYNKKEKIETLLKIAEWR